MDGNSVVYTHRMLYPLLCGWTPRLTTAIVKSTAISVDVKVTLWDVGLGLWDKIQDLNTIYS